MSDAIAKVTDAALDTLEVELDAASLPVLKALFGNVFAETIKDIPVVKWGPALAGVVRLGADAMRARRLLKFYGGISSAEDVEAYVAKLSDEDANRMRALILDLLDKQTSEVQAEALSHLFNAHIHGKIHKLIFDGVAHEITTINPLTFAFSVDGFTIQDPKDGIPFGNVLSGPAHYLPQAFLERDNATYWGGSPPKLSNLGKVFFDEVYIPMSKKYVG